MSNPASVSVAESSVYRGIYNELRQSSFQPSTEQLGPDDHGRFVDVNRWTFLQKLLAIEKAHDRKVLERKMLIKDRVCPVSEQEGECPVSKQDTPDKAVDTDVPDLLSRWLHHQVLEDGPDEPLNSDLTNHNHLPALSGIIHPATYVSQPLKLTSTRRSSEISDTSDDARSTVDDDSNMTSVSGRGTASSRMSRSNSIMEDNVIRSKRKRQLRLPPILLPRIYTVTPRPLQFREFLTPTKIRGPITDEEWEDLKDCRYIRHAVPRSALQMAPSNVSSLQF